MAVNITNEELDLFNKNGFTDDDVRATVENYRSQGLDDNAIRAKVQSKLDSWSTEKQPVEQTRTYPKESVKNMTEEEFKQNVDKLYDVPQVDIPQRGKLVNSDGEEKGNWFENLVNASEKFREEADQKYKDVAKEKLEKREEWEKAHPFISGIQKDYQPNYRADVEQWKLDAKYGMNKPIKEALKTDLKKAGLNLVPSTNIAVDIATGGSGAIAKQGLKELVKQGARQGAKTGVIGGLTQGVTSSLADNGISTDLLLRPLSYATAGLLGGGLIGSVAPIVAKPISAVAKNIKKPTTQVAKEVAEKPQVVKEVSAEIVEPQKTNLNTLKGDIRSNKFEQSNMKDYYSVNKGKKGYTSTLVDPISYDTEVAQRDFNKIITEIAKNPEKINDNAYVAELENRVQEIVDKTPYGNEKEVASEFWDRFWKAIDDGYKYNDFKAGGGKVVAPEQVIQPNGKTKERGFVETIRKNQGEDVAKQITDNEYEIYSHEMQKLNWENRTPEQKMQALSEVDNINPDVLYGKAQALNQAIQNGEPINTSMLNGIAKNLTKAGQEIEATKHFIPTSPEGIALEVVKQTRKNTPKQVLKLKDETNKVVEEVAKKLLKVKTKKQKLKAVENILSKRTVKPKEQKSLATQLLALHENDGLTPENFTKLVDKHYGIQTIDVSDYAKIQELSDNFINAKTDRERDIANGLIKKFIWNKQPKKWADKMRTYRNINMLLSVPSRLLDVASTTAFQGVRAIDELTAKGLDKIMRTGVRGSWKNMSPKDWAKSVKRGYQEGMEDVDLGINTARSGEVDRYELGYHPQFENTPVLGWSERQLNKTIRVPDRMFYEAKYDSSLKDLLSTGKFTQEEAEEIARKEALQAVFQGQGLFSGTSKDIRDWFDNLAPNLRIGSHIAPFVQTPANLIAEGIERSPLGLVKGIVQKSKATTPQELRLAQETLAKGLTGTIGSFGLGGYALNKLPNNIGGLTNEDVYGDEVRNLPPQSIVIGDKSISLAGAPYFTIPAGMGKSFFAPDKNLAEKTLNSIAYAGNILSDLPMYKGLGDLYKGVGNIFKEANEYATGTGDAQSVVNEIGRVVGQQGANALSQYIYGGGTLGTLRNAIDPYNRELMTYNENPILGTAEYIGNRLQNRIPFASSLLPMKYNVLGEPSMRTNIENPIARFAEATISPVRIRNYTERPAEMKEMQALQDFAMENDLKGKTTLAFAKPKRYIGKGKDKIKLTNEQYSEFTRLYNGKINEELKFLMNTPEYMDADEETRIKWVKEVLKEKKKEAEDELFDIIE